MSTPLRPILIGTIHLDLGAEYAPLYRTLNKIKPEVIAVEISKFSVSYRLKNQRTWLSTFYKNTEQLTKKERAHSGLKLLKLQIMMPFEWRAAMCYGKREDIPVLAIDSGVVAKNDMPFWKNRLLSPENICNIIKSEPFDLEGHFKRHHKIAEETIARPNSISDTLHPLRWLNDESWAKREGLLEKRVRCILKTKKKTVYIGGWMHIVVGSSYKTLAERLSDLNPQCILLNRDLLK